MWQLPQNTDHFFQADERRAVEALFEVLFPRDPARGIPGAADANAVEFVDRLLGMDETTYEKIPLWRDAYRAALPALDAECERRSGGRLADAEPAVRAEILSALEEGTLSIPGHDSTACFVMLWEHCLQGCFADPRWGGNRDGILWRWIGYLQDPVEVLPR